MYIDEEFEINIWWIKVILSFIFVAIVFLIALFIFIEVMMCGMGV